MAIDYRDPNATGRPATVFGNYANPMSAGQRRTPDQIEADIAATRARIESRLEGLSAQTAPARLLETTLGADLSSPTNTIESLYLRARSNPISAGLIGAGLLALYLGRKTEDPVAIAHARREAERDANREVPGPATRDAAERVAYDIAALKGHARSVGDDVSSVAASAKAGLTSTRDSTSSLADDAARTIEETKASATAKAGSIAATARETYDSVAETVSETYEGVTDKLSHAPTYARERAQYAGSWVQENPVAAGLIGLAAGAVAASVVAASKSKAPRSRAEATRRLYRQADGYSTAEELQRRATRPAPVSSTAGVRRASPGADTRTSAVPGAANPARSTASQAARRAPATAAETVGKTTSTSAKSTVGKTATKPKSAASSAKASSAKTVPVSAQTGTATRPAAKPGAGTSAKSTAGRASGTAKPASKTASKGGTGSNKPAPSASGTTYAASPSKGGAKKPKS